MTAYLDLKYDYLKETRTKSFVDIKCCNDDDDDISLTCDTSTLY